MALTRARDNRGQGYLVDWEQVNNIVCAHAYLRGFTKNAKQVREHGVLTVDFDHKLVRKEKQRYINETIPLVVQTIQADFTRGQGLLVTLRNQTLGYRAKRDELFSVAEASAKRFDWWMDKVIGTTQITRDVGFASIAVLAAPVGGAWALGATVVSAGGAAVGKYQDTGNVQSAIISGVGSLVMAGWGSVVKGADTVVNGVRTLAPGAKGVLIGMGCVMDSTLEMIGGVVEGKSGGDVTRAGVMKLLTGGLAAGIDVSKVANKLDAVWDNLDDLMKAVNPGTAAGKLAMEAAKKGTDKIGGAVLDQMSAADQAAAAQNGAFVRQQVLKPA